MKNIISCLIAIILYINSYGQWNILPQVTVQHLNCVQGFGSNVYIGGNNVLLKSNDNGTSWSATAMTYNGSQIIGEVKSIYLLIV